MQIELNTNGRRAVSPMGVGFVLAALVLALLLPAGFSVAQEKPEKTLYQRLGGYDVIAGIVGDFLSQLGKDPAFERFGQGRSQDSLKRSRQLIVDQICWMTGGPCAYIGRDMKTAHEGLKITEAEWEASNKKFKSSLDNFKIAEPEQQELLALIAKLKDDIVEKPKEGESKSQN